MTLRLGGSGRTSLAALASLTLAAALACGVAMTGCGGDSNPTTPPTADSGPDATGIDAAPDAPNMMMPDAGHEAAPGQCATPSFMPGAGTVAAGTAVAITSANLPAGGFIFYTTDGTLPTHASPALTSGMSITITQSETVRAVAFASTCVDSSVASAAYTVTPVTPDAGDAGLPPPPPACPTPTFAPGAGAIQAGSNVAITATGLPTSGFIYYTTDGTNPTHGSQVYSGPIQVNGNETIRALSAASTCTDSSIASAVYTTLLPDGGLPLPVFTPTAQTENNDFLLALSEATPGTLICYTLDGVTTPTCSTTATAATCTGTSAAYNAATRVNISGAVTDSATGKVTVQAIACGVGYTTTLPAKQTYTLQVAPPTMVNPAPGNTLFNDNGTMTAVWPTPSISTVTTGATIQVTTDGTSMPTCGVASPGTPAGATITINKNTVINAIGCKTGYAPSTVPDTLTYTIQLNPPVLPANTTPFYSAAAATITPDDTTNAGSTDWLCSTSDGTTPGCGTTAMSCTGTGATGATSPTTNNTTVKTIACKLGLTPSTVVTGGPYVLQLSPPGLSVPGFDMASGAPLTSYRIPVAGIAAPNAAQGQPITTPATPAVLAYGFTCVIDNGTPACGVNACTTGTQVAVGGAIPAVPVATDVWSIIGCPAATGASANFAPSVVTSVAFSAANGALAPSITPASAGPFTSQLKPQIANTDPTAVKICYTTDGSTPTCTNNACGVGTSFAADGAGAATLAFTVTAGGSGYNAGTPPIVSVSGGGGTCTGLTPTIAAGAVTAVTGTCSGYTSAPTVSFTGGGGSGATATALPSDVVVLGALSTDNTKVQAVACSGTLTSTAATARTYNFALAQPDFTLVQTTEVTGDQNGGGASGAGQQIQLSTASNFAGETIHYTTGGATATCATGTTVTWNGTSWATSVGSVITVPSSSPFTLSAIACGTAQQPSAARSASFTVGTAPVVIAPGTEVWENTVAPTLTSATAGAQVCYTTDGSNPGCSAGACTGATTTPIANAGMLPAIGTTGTTVKAVACTATLAASAPTQATYTLNISNVVVNIATQVANVCPAPSSFTLGLDQTTVSTDVGGPTFNATVCYTLDGTTPPANCSPLVAVSPATYVCFSTGAGGAGLSAVIPIRATQALSVVTCKTGFNAATTVPTTVPITAYSHTITVDGNLAEWTGATEQLSNGAANVGHFTHDGTNLYFGVSGGYTAVAGTDITIYVGDATSTATGPWTGPNAFGAPSLPFAPSYVFSWDTAGGSAPVALAYPGWTAAGFTPAVGFQSGTNVEFSVPIGALKSVNVLGAVVSGVGTAPALVEEWPGGTYANYLSDALNSCQAPNANLH